MCTASYFQGMNSYLQEEQELQGILHDKMVTGLEDVCVCKRKVVRKRTQRLKILPLSLCYFPYTDFKFVTLSKKDAADANI